MDVEKVFHMTGGFGETSYAKNSSLQKKASDMVKHITQETIQEIYLTTKPKSIGIADLGCSSGENTLSTIKEMVETIELSSHKIAYPSPEYHLYLNDLPGNDFNAIFKALPEFYRELKEKGGAKCVYVGGYPGSFYGRVFPDKCLHFIYSSYSLHWLSKVPEGLYDKKGKPINKANIYISESSPPIVSQSYSAQFHDDFSLFLRSRSEELVAGGKMVLILLGRSGPLHIDRGNQFFWELLSRSFSILISQGEIEEEKLDSYDVHFYAPSKEELENEVKEQGSFEMDRLEMYEIEKDIGGDESHISYGTSVAMTVRAIQESMISHHFGEGILESLFEQYGRLVDEEMAIKDIKAITLVLVLRKL
ncbi:hypothetical protein LguiB_033095 [Lonicera macranthoides]